MRGRSLKIIAGWIGGTIVRTWMRTLEEPAMAEIKDRSEPLVCLSLSSLFGRSRQTTKAEEITVLVVPPIGQEKHQGSGWNCFFGFFCSDKALPGRSWGEDRQRPSSNR